MQLTSIQKFWKDIEKYGYHKDSQFVLNVPLRLLEEIFEKATEFHKQEIIDAYNKSFELRDKPYSTADKYYQETFVSKGSDDHISDISKMVEDDVEKLAEEHYPIHEYTTEEWLKRRLAFKNGYRIAKETLYTEEQVIGFADWLGLNEYRYSRKYKCYQKILINETIFFKTKELFEKYIQSLKQPKQ